MTVSAALRLEASAGSGTLTGHAPLPRANGRTDAGQVAVRRNFEGRTLDISILELSLQNDLAELAVAAAQVDRFCAAHGLSPDIAFAVNLSVDELLTNTIRYGYPNGGSHRIAMTVRLHDGVLEVELEDEAEPYDPTTVPHPDTDAPIEARPIGGLGVHFVREMMDGFAYRRGGARNIVTLTKETRASGTVC